MIGGSLIRQGDEEFYTRHKVGNATNQNGGAENMNITTDELMAEIERLNQEQAEGFTVSEMVDVIGHGPEWCQRQLRALIKQKKARCNGRRKVPALTGP